MTKQRRLRAVYATQRANAQKRGIDWHFTYPEWIEWWVQQLGPDWFQFRGVHRDEYCMARHKDQGPYAPWNVECITNRKNCGDSISNQKINGTFKPPPVHLGEKHPNSKLTVDEVRKIFVSRLPQELIAAQYGVHWKTIHNIKHRLIWKNETVHLGLPGRSR